MFDTGRCGERVAGVVDYGFRVRSQRSGRSQLKKRRCFDGATRGGGATHVHWFDNIAVLREWNGVRSVGEHQTKSKHELEHGAIFALLILGWL